MANEIRAHLATHRSKKSAGKKSTRAKGYTSEWIPGDPIMEGDFRNCIICGAEVKAQNLVKHFSEKHPTFTNTLNWKTLDGTCPVCGKTMADPKGICAAHLIPVPQKFLIKSVLFPLRKKVTEKLTALEDEAASYLFLQMPMYLSTIIGNEPENISPYGLYNFSTSAVQYGYSLLRAFEIYGDLNKVAYKFANASSGKCIFRTKHDSAFINEILSEFEFYSAAFYGMKLFYDLATDSLEKPTKLFLIPKTDQQTILKLILLHISHLEAIHRSSFAGVLRPSTEQCVLDENGAFFCYPKQATSNHYGVFCASWSKSFPRSPVPTIKEYEGLRDLLKWVASPCGFTRENLTKARFLDDYKGFEFTEERFFSFIDGLLEELSTQTPLISHQALNKSKSLSEINHGLIDTATAFSLCDNDKKSYYLPVREWFYNKTMPVLTDVGRAADAAGRFFEQELSIVLEALSQDRLRFIYSPHSGLVPILNQPSKSKEVVDLKWRIVGKNLKISIDDPISEKIGKEGEIDLIVYANYQLYLLELKSLNLSSGRTNKYINEKAASQCLKYSYWLKGKDFQAFLQANGLSNDDIRAVRIICCTNGVFDSLEIGFETYEKFAVLPPFALYSLLAGLFTVAMREVLPEEIMGLRNGVLTAIPSVKNIGIIDVREEISKITNGIMNRWFSLMTFDRRKDYSQIDFGKQIPLYMSKFFIINESYLGNTWRWILDEPFQIGSANGWKFYVGTQLTEEGQTLICSNCKAAVKYYRSPDKEVDFAVQKIVAKQTCPFCGGQTIDHRKVPEIVAAMSTFVINYKRRHEDLLLDENLKNIRKRKP